MAEYNFLDDITKFSSNALSAANTLQRQVRGWVNDQVEYVIRSMDLVKNEDFALQLELRDKRIADLENAIAALTGKTAEPKTAANDTKPVDTKKPAVKKAKKAPAVKKAS